mmetsp:Transcript_25382/g.80071  ORF Transcript_25382/g.80071 Transcript_25382/m.80071 type:complete len:203 (+) Transcript_25382:635-1243(+)
MCPVKEKKSGCLGRCSKPMNMSSFTRIVAARKKAAASWPSGPKARKSRATSFDQREFLTLHTAKSCSCWVHKRWLSWSMISSTAGSMALRSTMKPSWSYDRSMSSVTSIAGRRGSEASADLAGGLSSAQGSERCSGTTILAGGCSSLASTGTPRMVATRPCIAPAEPGAPAGLRVRRAEAQCPSVEEPPSELPGPPAGRPWA